jgi:hypothetical protein
VQYDELLPFIAQILRNEPVCPPLARA